MPRRPGFTGPLILITLGFLLLSNNLGLIPHGFFGMLWRFWPVLLILLGLDVLAGQGDSKTTYVLGALLAIAIICGVIAVTWIDAPLLQRDLTDTDRDDLSGMHLEGMNRFFSDMSHKNLSGAHLEGANLLFVDMSNANLEGAHLNGANIIFADMTGANLKYADVDGADLIFVDLSGADLEGTDIEKADLFVVEMNGW